MREKTKFILFVSLALLLFVGVTRAACAQTPGPCNCNGACEDALGENCHTCPQDCRGPCCGDGACSSALGEDCYTCPADCGTVCSTLCGDRNCDPGESAASCPSDCSKCGNGACEGAAGENCYNCRADCGPCPSCTIENSDSVCPAALHPMQLNCTFYYCDPQSKTCVFDGNSYTGNPCSNELAPYTDQCHVDVCIRGLCVLRAPINSADKNSAGGLPALTNPETPWLKGECVYQGGDFVYTETEIHPYCGAWGCEATETQANCCADCGCPAGEMCIADKCQSITALTAASGFSLDGWVPLVVLALLFGYFLAALVYMVSHIIGSPELEAWSKSELYEVSASAMLVGSAFFFIGLLIAVSTELTGASYVQIADNYVHNLSGELLRIYGLMLKGVFAMGFLGYLGTELSIVLVPTGIVNIGVTGQLYPFGGMNLLSNSLIMFTNIVSFAIMATIGQKVILDFVLGSAFRILLPVAIVLRCFTFTRKLGATLMAIAIGAYIVYPITLVMNDQIYNSVDKLPQSEYHSSTFPLDQFNMGAWSDLFLGPNFGKFCKTVWDWIAFCWLRAIIAWVISFVVALFTTLAFILKVLAQVLTHGVAEVTASGFDYYANMIPWAMQPITAAFLFPVLDLIIVVTAMRSLSEAIGGESRITGLAQFI